MSERVAQMERSLIRGGPSAEKLSPHSAPLHANYEAGAIMRRREFITLFGGAAASWPLPGYAQTTAMPVIGWLSGRSRETDDLVLPAFRRGLSVYGYVEGKNYTMDYRRAEGRYERLPALAAELVRKPVSVLVLAGLNPDGYRAAKAATATIPIVFITGANPVTSGLVASFNRPGGNLTGIVLLFKELGGKRLGLLHELLPKATTLALLINPGSVGANQELDDVQTAAKSVGLEVKIFTADTDGEIDAAFARLGEAHLDALLVLTDPFFFDRVDKIVSSANRIAIPAMYIRREFAAAGGLISYGSDTDETYAALGDYVGRILHGANPDDLPVQQAVKLQIVINLKTAKALDIEVPPTLLASADEVIE